MLTGNKRVRRDAWGSRKKTRSYKNGPVNSLSYKRQLINLAISIVLVILIILFKSINIPFTQRATEKIKETVNLDYSIADMVNSLSFLKQASKNVSESVVKVFNPSTGNEVPIAQSLNKDLKPIFPTEGEILVPFGEVSHPVFGTKYYNYGIDVKPKVSEVKAALHGRVMKTGEEAGMGKYIVIAHENEVTTIYKNLSSILVKKDDVVNTGTIIAKVNNTQEIGGHLRLEVMKKDQYINPVEYFSSN